MNNVFKHTKSISINLVSFVLLYNVLMAQGAEYETKSRPTFGQNDLENYKLDLVSKTRLKFLISIFVLTENVADLLPKLENV